MRGSGRAAATRRGDSGARTATTCCGQCCSGTGAFHPKTYLLGNVSEGRLLVGSGNLTMAGVERGREVFSEFRSTEPDDVGSIRGWRQWMDGIVERLADEEVTYRWLRLRSRVR